MKFYKSFVTHTSHCESGLPSKFLKIVFILLFYRSKDLSDSIQDEFFKQI